MKEAILEELRCLIGQIREFHNRFGSNDIRSSFIDGYFEILKNYYFGYFQFDEIDTLNIYQEIYQDYNIVQDDLEPHIQNQKQGHNINLIVNCWSNFELFITLFCYSVLPENQVTELLELDYRKIKKIISEYSTKPGTESKLKKLIKNHLSHVSNNRKYGKILKLISSYPEERDKSFDIEFLDFFSRLRNCMHSNFIYYGAKDKEFRFQGERFRFEYQKPVSQNPWREITTFELTLYLKQIFQLIVEDISHDGLICDPSVEM